MSGFKPTLLSILIVAATMLPVAADTPKTSSSPATTAKLAKPLMSKHQAESDTITMLEKAKKTLEADTSKDVNNHKANALKDIMKAMEELRAITQGAKH